LKPTRGSQNEWILTNLLAAPLHRPREHRIVTQVAGADGSRHPVYRLTAKGEALRPVPEEPRDWGMAWLMKCQISESKPGPSANSRMKTRNNTPT
jgi:DNA-binding HxlR family transcriptional regulator